MGSRAHPYDLGRLCPRDPPIPICGPLLGQLADGRLSDPDLGVTVRFKLPELWGPEVAAQLGLFSIVSYRLFSTGESLGALNLYGKDRSAFSTDDIHDGTALAAHVGVALAGAQEVESLEMALAGRTVIGQATGILIERFDLSPDRAFTVLTRLSQHKNVKLRLLAEQIVHSRKVPMA